MRRLKKYKQLTIIITVLAVLLNIYGLTVRPYMEIHNQRIEQLLVIATMFATVLTIFRWARIFGDDID